MPVLCARLLIDCSTLSAPCLEAELRLIHRSRAKSRRVRRSSSESCSGLNAHEELRSHHLERRGGANGDSWPVSGGCIHSLPVRSCRKIRGSKKKCLQKRGEFVPCRFLATTWPSFLGLPCQRRCRQTSPVPLLAPGSLVSLCERGPPFRCHYSARITYSIAGACGALIRK